MRSSLAAAEWKVPPQTVAPDRGGSARLGERTQQPLGASQHLGGRAPSEREQQDRARVDAAGDEDRHAMRERRGLAGPGAGDDKQRPVAVSGRAQLVRIEIAADEADGGVVLGGCHGELLFGGHTADASTTLLLMSNKCSLLEALPAWFDAGRCAMR